MVHGWTFNQHWPGASPAFRLSVAGPAGVWSLLGPTLSLLDKDPPGRETSQVHTAPLGEVQDGENRAEALTDLGSSPR